MNAQQAKEYWEKMQQQEAMFPNAHIYTNIKNQGVDMEKMAENNPYLFQMFMSIFSGVETSQNVQTWKNYHQAYVELEAQGLLKFSNSREKVMQEKIDEFVKKVDGPCLVPKEQLEEVITEKKRKGVVSIQVDFDDYMTLLENHYKFEHRDFFGRFGKKTNNEAALLGLTKEEYEKHSKFSPAQDVIAAKMSVLYSLHQENEGMPYADFWNYLTDHDFMDVSNGSVNTMWLEHETEDDEDDGIVIPAIVFDKMRQLMFKEIAQYSYYENQQPNEIEFYISW